MEYSQERGRDSSPVPTNSSLPSPPPSFNPVPHPFPSTSSSPNLDNSPRLSSPLHSTTHTRSPQRFFFRTFPPLAYLLSALNHPNTFLSSQPSSATIFGLPFRHNESLGKRRFTPSTTLRLDMFAAMTAAQHDVTVVIVRNTIKSPVDEATMPTVTRPAWCRHQDCGGKLTLSSSTPLSPSRRSFPLFHCTRTFANALSIETMAYQIYPYIGTWYAKNACEYALKWGGGGRSGDKQENSVLALHKVLLTSVDLFELAPVPGLQAAARTLLEIWDSLQEVDVSEGNHGLSIRLLYRQSRSLCSAAVRAAPPNLHGRLISWMTGEGIVTGFVKVGPTTVVNLFLFHPLSSAIKKPAENDSQLFLYVSLCALLAFPSSPYSDAIGYTLIHVLTEAVTFFVTEFEYHFYPEFNADPSTLLSSTIRALVVSAQYPPRLRYIFIIHEIALILQPPFLSSAYSGIGRKSYLLNALFYRQSCAPWAAVLQALPLVDLDVG
ncbi:hypothetical protein GYMLUDRAFT_250285 [Collybiopsis luxurians FD-317 M1]|uniref:Unplaced genomic scaffold GYMLUscaffold_79, whole genome shotgun sequence n=1 Tax=Collybiopsis luxurians FD-317 M1 TaxID=944289 RepID=A0A0D0AT37_9AGAR|nr:hypothetical protein GYMLUDRAFT_250285 [Collybiopsis luxurians FD-317 M1]